MAKIKVACFFLGHGVVVGFGKFWKSLMDQFVKHRIMAPVSSAHQLLKINVELRVSHKVYWKVDNLSIYLWQRRL